MICPCCGGRSEPTTGDARCEWCRHVCWRAGVDGLAYLHYATVSYGGTRLPWGVEGKS